jgi:hypothetical protein
MELAFATERLRAVCEDGMIAGTEYDRMFVEQLQARLADLRAAGSIYDLLAGNPRTESGRLTVEVTNGYVLVARPNHRVAPLRADGEVDWGRVRRLHILELSR